MLSQKAQEDKTITKSSIVFNNMARIHTLIAKTIVIEDNHAQETDYEHT